MLRKRKFSLFNPSIRVLRSFWLFPVCVLLLFTASFAAAQEPPIAAPGTEPSEPAPLAPRSLLLDAVSSGNRIIAVGERGHVLLSENRGTDWTQIIVPTRSMLTAVAMPDDRNVWAVGHDEVILHSADGGRTWVRQYYAPEDETPLFDVWFENEHHGLAVGAYGLLLETHDGGKTWARRAVDAEERHLNAIVRSSDGTLFVPAESGLVFRSSDNGETWEGLRTPYQGSFFGAAALPDASLLVFGLRGNIYRSTDRGQTWQQVPTCTTAGLMGAHVFPDGTVVIVGLSGTVLVSHDGGTSFHPVERTDRLGLSAVVPAGPEDALLLGEGGAKRDGSLLKQGPNLSSGKSQGK
jgi:photosystem II stability/assembly factor-like uncharacterized protein